MKKKYRLLEINCPFHNGPYWRIEKKNWLGYWVEPSLNYSENATYYKKEDAEREFNFLTGITSVTEKIILSN